MILECTARGCAQRAVALAPQLHELPPDVSRPIVWKWVPSCQHHLRGWWHGCEVAIDERPPIVPFHPRQEAEGR